MATSSESRFDIPRTINARPWKPCAYPYNQWRATPSSGSGRGRSLQHIPDPAERISIDTLNPPPTDAAKLHFRMLLFLRGRKIGGGCASTTSTVTSCRTNGTEICQSSLATGKAGSHEGSPIARSPKHWPQPRTSPNQPLNLMLRHRATPSALNCLQPTQQAGRHRTSP